MTLKRLLSSLFLFLFTFNLSVANVWSRTEKANQGGLATPLTSPQNTSTSLRRLTLADAERRAFHDSLRVDAARLSADAAHEQARAQWATFFPKLSLEANYRYNSEIPKLRVGIQDQPFGDNESYSVGPVLSWTLWDSGARKHLYRSLLNSEKSKRSERDLVQKQMLFATQIAYVQTQLATLENQFVRESLDSALKQNQDIEKRFGSGAASRLEFLESKMNVSTYEVRAHQSEANLLATTADLNALIGESDLQNRWELDTWEAKSIVNNSLKLSLDERHPRVVSKESLAASFEEAAKGRDAGHWPTLQIQGKSSLDYPHGPSLQQVQQNSVMVNFMWPIFEFGRVDSEAQQRRNESLSLRRSREQESVDLQRDWTKAAKLLISLNAQRQNAQEAVDRGVELSKLKMSAYKYGKINFVDVQSVNLRLLEARITLARIEAQMWIQFFTLKSLAPTEAQ